MSAEGRQLWFVRWRQGLGFAVVVVASAGASASDYEVLALVAPTPRDNSVTASVDRTREWATTNGADTDSLDVNLSASAAGPDTDGSLAADRSSLSLPRLTTLVQDELEAIARVRDGAGNEVTADISVDMAEGGRARFMDRLDGSFVLVVHPGASSRHSLAYVLWATTQPFYPLPPVAPGIAYCYATDSLTAVIGVPFSALTWKATPHVEVSGSIADSARLSAAYEHQTWATAVVAKWATSTYRVMSGGSRGSLETWEEAGVAVELSSRPVPGIEIDVSAGRQMSRRLFTNAGHVLLDAGGAWAGTVSLGVAW